MFVVAVRPRSWCPYCVLIVYSLVRCHLPRIARNCLALWLLAFAGGSGNAAVYEVSDGGDFSRIDSAAVAVRPLSLSNSVDLPTRRSKRAYTYRPYVKLAADQFAVSPALVDAIAQHESGYNQAAVSRARAVGIMQLMPGTARQMGVDSSDAEANIRGGAAYLRYLLNRYDGDIVCTIAAYNAGPGAVSKSRCVPNFRETRTYVARVLDHLARAAN